MRGATECARRLKRLIRTLRAKLGRVAPPPADDPVTQLIVGIFSRDVPESRAREVLERLRGLVVDYNELRVVSPRELAEHIGDYPDAWTKCEDMSRALNRIFTRQHSVSLDELRDRPRKEVKDYLDRIEGLEPYTRARIRLLGLGQHAFPLDEAMWAYAVASRIVAPNCSLEEAQAFLERHVPEDEALEAFSLIRKQAWIEFGEAVRQRRTRRIESVPPDRASRNMLQPVVYGPPGGAEDDESPAQADSAGAPSARGRTPVAARRSAVRSRRTARPQPDARPPRRTRRASGHGERTARRATRQGT